MWWSSLLGDLVKPSWAAGVIQAFVGAALAFGGALLLIRIQLRSDRRLVDEQIKAMADDRTAERRSNVAERLGRSLIEASLSPNAPDWRDYLDAVRKSQIPTGALDLINAVSDAELILDLDPTVRDMWWCHMWVWDAVRVNLRRYDGTPLTSRGEQALQAGCKNLLAPVNKRLADLGHAFIRWDGTGAVPSMHQLGVGWEVPSPNSEAFPQWAAAQTEIFEKARSDSLRM